MTVLAFFVLRERVGAVIFAEYPDAWVYLGSIIIVGAGIYVWYREISRGETPLPAAPPH